jgi:hypothetical protein
MYSVQWKFGGLKQNSQNPLSSRDILYVILLGKKRRRTYRCQQNTDGVVSVVRWIVFIFSNWTSIAGPSGPRGLRCRYAAARLLRLWVRIQPGAWMFVYCECCMLSGRGLCDELITHPEESYWLWRVVLRGLETSWMRKPWPTGGCRAKHKLDVYYWRY